MSSVTVDELVMRIEIELDKFKSEAGQAESIEKNLRAAIKGTGEASKEAGKEVDKMAAKIGESSKALSKQQQAFMAATSRAVAFLGALAASNAIVKFTAAISNANDQLGFMSKRLGMAARDIKGMDTAVAGLGGAGASAQNTMKILNQGIQEMVLMGDSTLIPFFSKLEVGVIDAYGKIRNMKDITLDMADAFHQMDPQQAYAIASAMGLDDGMANAIIQGRDAWQEMLDMQKKAYVSSKEDIAASRELSKAQAFLSAQWEGMKTMLANALIPVLLKMTKVVSGWMDYLSRNERTVRNFFEGIAIAVGVMLIPVLIKAGVAMLALMSPILVAAAVVTILAAAFGLLYDDYKTWAEGGKSLFDWTMFDKYIRDTNVSVDSLAKGFSQLLTGYDSLDEAQSAFMKWLKDKGIIDQNGISVRALGDAFKQLGKDIYESMPHLKTMIEMVGAIMDGRFGDALALAKSIPAQVASTVVGAYGSAVGHTTGAIDTMLGHEAGSEGTISGGIKSGTAWLKTQLAQWAGGGSQSGAQSKGFSADNAASVARVAGELGLDPNDLAQIISFETGGTFNTNARNPNSSATGLIQKMADPDGKYYGHTRDELGSMSFDDQMEKVVKRYFQERGFSDGRTHSLGDAYEAVTGSGYKKGSQAYDLNSVWDADGNGVIDKNEAVNAPQFQAHGKDWMGAQRAIQMTGIPGVPGGGISNNQGGAQVTIGSVTVQTSATTLPEATAAGVAAGVSRSSQLINQLGGGIQ